MHIDLAVNGYDARRMLSTDLAAALETADSRLGWVDLIARYFDAYDLCYGHGTESAADEAFWLVWQSSGTPDTLEGLAPEASLIPRIVELARRRAEDRVPLAYLLGVAWFAGLAFEAGPSVLIPRSPLAELVLNRFAPWCELQAGDKVLEIGTGSGCIAIAAAVHNPGIRVDATEIDRAALPTARRNVARHGVGERVRLIEADLYPADEGDYRVIIANPPYVPTRDLGSLPAEYRHEPASALDGGMDGLDVVRRILAGAGRRLAGDGVLIVEVGLSADTLMAEYPRVPWTWLEFERGGEGVFLLTANELTDGWG